MLAAEALLAHGGIDGVSLREINRAAHCRNATAIQYHFKNREGLIQAVLLPHLQMVEQERRILLDEHEQGGGSTPRDLAAILVRPLAQRLLTQSGKYFLQIYGSALVQPASTQLAGEMAVEDSTIDHWRHLVDPVLDQDAAVLHRRYATITYTITELSRRAQLDKTRHDLFTSMLIDSASAMLAAPTSSETRSILRARQLKNLS